MNQFSLIGRCTKDIECRYTTGQNPTAVAEFNIAVQRDRETADFPRITVFGKQAENCEKYVGKGSQIGVTGYINTGSYENSEGKTVYYTRLIANRVEFLGGKSDSTKQDAPAEDIPTGFNQLDDDIPF